MFIYRLVPIYDGVPVPLNPLNSLVFLRQEQLFSHNQKDQLVSIYKRKDWTGEWEEKGEGSGSHLTIFSFPNDTTQLNLNDYLQKSSYKDHYKGSAKITITYIFHTVYVCISFYILNNSGLIIFEVALFNSLSKY